MKFDTINKPKHYNVHPSGIECIHINESFTANLAAAFKYVWRFKDKKKPAEDLKKAIWYLKRELDRYKGIMLNSGTFKPRDIYSSNLEKRMMKVLGCESGHRYGALAAIWNAQVKDSPRAEMSNAIQHIEYLIEELEL